MNISHIAIFLLICLSIAACQETPQPVAEEAPTEQAATDPLAAANQDISNSRENAITRAVKNVSPAVVGINVTQVQEVRRRSPFDDPLWRNFFPELYRNRKMRRKVESLGSGFLISADGYVVSNHHVVENASEIVVTMTGGRRYNARLIGSDRETDVALLKIDGNDFPYIPFGRSDNLLVGEWVIALGNPFGLFKLNDTPTVTVGVISAIDRDWGRTEEGQLFLDMIQTDAAINRGNSGGPLVNAEGKIIGMNTFIYTGSQYSEGSVGIGFAIPVDRLKELVDEIRETGRVNREFWIGINDVQSLNPYIVAALKLKVKEGVIITQIESGSPAFRAGLRDEDVIIGLGNRAIRNRDEMIDALRNMDLKVGATVSFVVARGTEGERIDVKLAPRPGSR